MNFDAVAYLPIPFREPAIEFIEPWISRISAIYFIFSSVILTKAFDVVKNSVICLLRELIEWYLPWK